MRYVDGEIVDLSVTSTLQLAPLLKDFRKHLQTVLESDPTLADHIEAVGKERHRIAHAFITPDGAVKMRDFLAGTALPTPLTTTECLDFEESCKSLFERLNALRNAIADQRAAPR